MARFDVLDHLRARRVPSDRHSSILMGRSRLRRSRRHQRHVKSDGVRRAIPVPRRCPWRCAYLPGVPSETHGSYRACRRPRGRRRGFRSRVISSISASAADDAVLDDAACSGACRPTPTARRRRLGRSPRRTAGCRPTRGCGIDVVVDVRVPPGVPPSATAHRRCRACMPRNRGSARGPPDSRVRAVAASLVRMRRVGRAADGEDDGTPPSRQGQQHHEAQSGTTPTSAPTATRHDRITCTTTHATAP